MKNLIYNQNNPNTSSGESCLKSNGDRPTTPMKPDRLNLNQTEIAPQHPQNPIAYFSTSTSDRLSTPTKPDRLFSQHKTAIAYHPEIFAQICIDNVNTLWLRYDIWMYILY